MANPLEKLGETGSMDLNGTSGLQLPFEIHGNPIIPCLPSTSAGKWSGEPPKGGVSSSALNPTNLDSFICMASWNSLIGPSPNKQQPTSGTTSSKRSDARKCLRCGKVRVHPSTSQSTSPRNSQSSLSSEVKA